MELIIYFLFFCATIKQISSECREELTETMDHEIVVYYYRHPRLILSSLTTCTNVSSISDLPHSFKTEKYQQFLKITQSHISVLTNFSCCQVITKLFLSQNYVETILPGAFGPLTNLRELYLDNNNLTKVSNGVFNSLSRLEILNLGNNKIQVVDKSALVGVDQLVELYLYDNYISEINDEFFRTLKDLKILDLSRNPLVKVPDCQISDMELLALSETSLSQFDVDLSNSSVNKLNLSSNLLTILDFKYFPVSKTLDCSRNKIVSLMNYKNVNVSVVNLNNNEIVTLKGSFPDMSKLYIAHNHFKILEESLFSQSESLELIDFSYNSISKIDRNAFLKLINLESLILHHNAITKIDPAIFQKLKKLEILDLSHNKIEEFQFGTFDNLKFLSTLDISYNNMKELHQYSFSSLKYLSHLNFDNNQISSFDVAYLSEHLFNLKSVSLNRNRWSCQDLVKIEHVLNLHDIEIVEGDSFDVENFHGVACTNNKDFEKHHLAEHFETALDQGVGKLFEKDFVKSKFLQYFDSHKHAAKTPAAERSGGALLATSAVQVVVSSMLLFMVCAIFVYLKKLKVKRFSEFSSQMELQ